MTTSRQPGSGAASSVKNTLWRWSEDLLGPDQADEVLGDLLETSVTHTTTGGSNLRAPECLPWTVVLRAATIALTIRLQTTPARNGGLRRGLFVLFGETQLAGRRLRRAPVFTSLSLASMTIGAAASLAVLAIVYTVLLSPLPFHDPDRLVAIFTTERDGAERRNPSSAADFLDWQEASPDLATLAAAEFWNPGFEGTKGTHRQKLVALRVTDNLLEMLGVAPLLGRTLSPGDLSDTVVISENTWQKRLGGRLDVLGSAIRLNGKPHTVVGVMPESFAFPPFWATDAELWVPLTFEAEPRRGGRGFRVFGRTRGASLEHLEIRLSEIQADLAASFPETNRGTGVQVESLKEPVVGDARRSLTLLGAGATLLLLLMGANLTGLLLARGLERRHSTATQLALGAGRGRLVLAPMVEGSLLMTGAGLLGALAATIGLRLFKTFGAGAVPRLQEVELSPVVCLAATATLGVLGLAVGFIPGVRLMLDSGRSYASAAARFPKAELWRRAIVTAEVALTTALLLLAGWLVRSLDRLASEDLGFETAGVFALPVDLEEGQKSAQLRLLLDTLKEQPGLEATGAINHLPLDGDLWRGRVFGVGSSKAHDDVRAALRVATPGYFTTMKLKLHTGRLFTDSDRGDGEAVAVINRTLAAELWPQHPDPTGQVLAQDSLDEGSPRLRVVGVVENVKQESIDQAAPPELYFPMSQDPFAWFPSTTLVARARTGADLDVQALQRALTSRLPGIALGSPRSLEQVVGDDLLDERARTFALVLFAGLSVLLATAGLFGVVAFAAHQRQKELGLRIALGSWPRDVVWLILREGAGLAALGALLGGLGALAATPWLGNLLYDTSALDPVVWTSVAASVVGLTALAALPPALRASRTDPARVLDRR